MIRKIINFLSNMSIENKVVISIVFFAFLIASIDRYYMSQNIHTQFIKAKKLKNTLLVNTISPVLSLNLSLGLNQSNEEYLDYILEQNLDIIYIELKDINNNVVYKKNKTNEKYNYKNEKENFNFCTKKIFDTATNDVIATLQIHFSQKDFKKLKSYNRYLTIKLLLIVMLLLVVFILMIRREFRPLKELSENVLLYDPKLNNFSLTHSNKKDEVGVIQNAIILMVEKIKSHTKMLDELNLSLEEKIKDRTKELEKANEDLKFLSITDELTQLSNRRYFENYLDKVWELGKRKSEKVSVIMCDIDHFKRVNDTYGHQIGDEVLKIVASALKKSLKRNTDFVARYGGEEFIIVLYGVNLDEARIMCKRVQENLIYLQSFSYSERNISPVTLSFGISCTTPKKQNTSDLLVKEADDALYKAKENGRNCIVG